MFLRRQQATALGNLRLDTGIISAGWDAGQAADGDIRRTGGLDLGQSPIDLDMEILLTDDAATLTGLDDTRSDLASQADTLVLQPDTFAWQLEVGTGEPDATSQPDASNQQEVPNQSDALSLPDQAADQTTTPDLPPQESASRDTTSADSPPPAFCNPADLDLVACYRFEGRIDDGSSYGNQGTASSVTYVTGTAGQAVRTTGTSDISVPASSSLSPANAITIELWVQPQSTLATGRAGLVDNEGQYGLFVHPGNAITCTAAGGSVSASAVLTAAVWTHVACVYDGATLRLYRNGSQVGSLSQTGRLTTSGTSGMSIGHNNPTGDPFDGAIDGLRIWRVARPAGLLCTQPADCG